MTKFGYKLIAKTNTSLKKINIITYFENLTVRLHVLYACKICRKLKINSFVINKWFKLQVFVI